MATLEIDGDEILTDTQPNIDAAIQAIRHNLKHHRVIHLSVYVGIRVKDRVSITKNTAMLCLGGNGPMDDDLYARLTAESASNSDEIYWFAGDKGFVPDSRSRSW